MIDVVDVGREEWERESVRFADMTYRQSWAFGHACAARVGAESRHVRFESHGRLIGLADVRVRRIPLVGGGLAYVTGGPLVDRSDLEGSAPERLAWCLRGLVERFGRKEGMTVRVAPSPRLERDGDAIRASFERAGFCHAESTKARRTILVDLAPDESVLRAGLAQKWRNCLNAAERENLQIEEARDGSLFDRFCVMFGDVTARKGFSADLDARFHERVQLASSEHERFAVTLVRSGHEDAAGHIGSELGHTSVYLLGASNDVGRRTKASYLLQWHVLVRAKRAGLGVYDLGGIDVESNPGVYRFKSGMGGVELDIAGPFERVSRGWRGSLVRAAERARDARRARGKSGASA